MPNVNVVHLVGNVVRDPELRYTPTGDAVCEFSLALNRSYTQKASGQKVDEVSFVDIVAWKRTAEIAAEYLKKGHLVYLEGHLKQDRWETPEGQKRSKLKVVASNIQFLEKRQGATTPSEPKANEDAEIVQEY